MAPRLRLLELSEAAYGSDHREVAPILNNLGNAWRELGQPAKARDLFQRALAIEEREYGSDHPQVAPTLNNLGIAWSDLGQPAKARDLSQRALRILHQHFPGGHPFTDGIARNLRRVDPDAVLLSDGRVVRRAGGRPPDVQQLS